MKERLYIIGGSGFIGKHLCKALEDEYEISVFDRWIDEEFFGARPGIKAWRHDILTEEIAESFPCPDYIINLASTMVTAERNMDGVGDLIAENIKIISNLFNRFKSGKELKLFIHFGSIEEYGPIEPPLNEKCREYPNSAYSLMKQACTNYCRILHDNEAFPACVVRPGNLFGKGQNPRRFIPYVLERLRADAPVEVTPCEQKRDFIYIDDFTSLIGRILKKAKAFPGEIVNVCSGRSIALKQIIEKLRIETASRSEIRYGALPYRAGEVMDLRCSVDRLEELLGEKLNIDTLARLEEYARS